jgi:hypothetical protein
MKAVIFARHADVELPPTSSDPALNAAGVARAEMIAAVGVNAPQAIGDREFDNLFLVTVAGSGEAALLALKYGKPSVA